MGRACQLMELDSFCSFDSHSVVQYSSGQFVCVPFWASFNVMGPDQVLETSSVAKAGLKLTMRGLVGSYCSCDTNYDFRRNAYELSLSHEISAVVICLVMFLFWSLSMSGKAVPLILHHLLYGRQKITPQLTKVLNGYPSCWISCPAK
jgi:hypothetical protein